MSRGQSCSALTKRRAEQFPVLLRLPLCAARGTLGAYPRINLSRCALRSPPGTTFLSFSDSIGSAPHVEETCIDCPSAACCEAPRSRAMPACDICFPCHHRTGPAFAGSIVVDRVRCLAGRAAALSRSAIPTRPTALAAGPACDTFSRARVRRLSTRTTVANRPANRLRCFFSGRARRSSSVQGSVRCNSDHIPPPPSPFNPPLCVGLHATVPASCAERVRPMLTQA